MLVLLALWGPSASASDALPPPAPVDPSGASVQRWAGEQVTVAVRRVPLLGDITSRTTIKTLAWVQETPDGLVMTDRPCRIDIENSGGVDLDFDPAAVERMPPATNRYVPAGAEAGAEAGAGFDLTAGPWVAGWGETDVDEDGRPGISVRVRAPLCGGSLDIASQTLSVSRARREAGGLVGRVDVHIDRKILGVSQACLSLAPKRNLEDVRGAFAFVPVDPAATCASFGGGWPVTAPEP